MQFGAGFLGTATLTSILGINPLDSEPVVAQNDTTPEQALTQLMEGNQRFINDKRLNPNQSVQYLQYLQSLSQEQYFGTNRTCRYRLSRSTRR